MTSNLKSISEIAPVLNCAEITVRRLIKARKIPFYKIGSRYLFTDEAVQQYLDSVKVEPLTDTVGGKK
jgi:excisionase family DNA binding protein